MGRCDSGKPARGFRWAVRCIVARSFSWEADALGAIQVVMASGDRPRGSQVDTRPGGRSLDATYRRRYPFVHKCGLARYGSPTSVASRITPSSSPVSRSRPRKNSRAI